MQIRYRHRYRHRYTDRHRHRCRHGHRHRHRDRHRDRNEERGTSEAEAMTSGGAMGPTQDFTPNLPMSGSTAVQFRM